MICKSTVAYSLFSFLLSVLVSVCFTLPTLAKLTQAICNSHSVLCSIAEALRKIFPALTNDIPEVPGSPKVQANSTPALETQLLITACFGVPLFLIFCLLRRTWHAMYTPRSRLRRNSPPPISNTFFGWIIPVLRYPQSDMLERVGLDAVMLLKFFQMSILLFASSSVFGVIILLPINYINAVDTQNKSLSFAVALTRLSIPKGSKVFAAHSVFTWFFSLLTFYFLYRTYEQYIYLRWTYLIEVSKSVGGRSVMVTSIPEKLRSNAALQQFFEKLNVGPVETAHVCPHLQELPRILEKRAEYLRKLEDAYVRCIGNPCELKGIDPQQLVDAAWNTEGSLGEFESNLKRPSMKAGFFGLFGRKVDMIQHYHRLMKNYDFLVNKARSLNYPPSSVGFVTFVNQNSANIVAQTLTHTRAFTCVTKFAPDPRDIAWNNLYRTRREILIRKVIIEAAIFFLMFFWAYPVATLASWLGVDALEKLTIDGGTATGRVILKFLPSIFVLVFMAILPFILETLIKIQRKPSRSLTEMAVLKKYFLFQLINVLLIFTVASTFFSSFYAILDKPTEVTTILGRQLPLFAPFFINYVTILGLGYLPLKLVQLGPMILFVVRKLFSSSPRDFAELLTPVNIDYGWVYPVPMLVFVIVLTYSVMTPLILVFGAAYFSIAYLFHKYNFLYVYFRRFETGGIFWPVVVRRLVVGIFIFQLTMLGVLILNDALIPGLLIAPLFVITIYFYHYVVRTLEKRGQYLPLELSEFVIPGLPRERENTDMQPIKDVDLLDDDQYEATPTRKTDYRESPMSRCSGILDASERAYSHPAIVGMLPKLWLPRRLNPKTGTQSLDPEDMVYGSLTSEKQKSFNDMIHVQPENHESNSNVEILPNPTEETNPHHSDQQQMEILKPVDPLFQIGYKMKKAVRDGARVIAKLNMG
ncbi:hypothetical protein K7432_006700 [Basidiobolus ranarum]|uniref:DUF221-domain-containing protein n=1 Tax=Basidiobolus ranarum TaxID=34480 RepID=A0ABR2W195_9FUNG